MNKSNLSRRNFFKGALAAAALGTFAMWDKMVKTKHLTTAKKNLKLLFNRNKEVLFADDFIIVNRLDKTEVFSAHCTHLGCLINRFEDGKLACPCHGSEFSLNGTALKGPAYKPLKKENFHFDKERKYIVIS